jgi:hypothetical protein
MATFADLATLSLQHLMVLQTGEVPTSSDLALCLSKANLMLDEWAADGLMIPCITRTTWTISGSSYTVGTGGTINIVRPEFIDHVSYYDTSLTTPNEIPLITLTDDAYASYTVKTLQSVYPQMYWYNPTYASGFGTLILLPVPTSTTLMGVMYAKTALAEIAATSTTMTYPPGYKNMLVTNLAVRLAALYEREPSQTLSEEASKSLATVMRKNIRLSDLSVDQGALGERPYWGRASFYSGS